MVGVRTKSAPAHVSPVGRHPRSRISNCDISPSVPCDIIDMSVTTHLGRRTKSVPPGLRSEEISCNTDMDTISTLDCPVSSFQSLSWDPVLSGVNNTYPVMTQNGEYVVKN